MVRNTRELSYIHKLSSSHREAVLAATRCGCLYCLAIFTPDEIMDWVDDDEVTGEGRTALCPRCGIDSVIPSGRGVVIDLELLIEMKRHYFGMIGDAERAAARGGRG